MISKKRRADPAGVYNFNGKIEKGTDHKLDPKNKNEKKKNSTKA